ncbi:AfsR/SARP family transcriptional regulator [Streptomyces griseorubiginosus]|uniref:AfsR/SARP family transcriptional regulator n=1 Tax=Streptomyces griseorubiginosus TaxID=67304 RepID=UPI00365440A6
MEIKVLGPLEVRENGVSVAPSASKPRQVLALLALRAGHVVPVPTLMDEIWGDRIPQSAVTTLQTYILQLRRKLSAAHADTGSGRSSKEILATAYGGYLLTREGTDSDAAEFERLAARGSAALEQGDARAAATLLARALGLWRGPALVDVQPGNILGLELQGLEEARMQALSQRIEADLRLGRHAVLLRELRVLVAQHPLQETLCGQFMLALYRSGSAWRALEAYQRLRRTLSDELGIEPSPQLKRLHQAMLTGDPALTPEPVSLMESFLMTG